MDDFDAQHEKNAKIDSFSTEDLRLRGSVNKFEDTDGVVFALIYK